MNPPAHSVWLHRLAWLTAALTLLLPVTTGAVVTTLKAGMVFADWPSSDGYNMLAYPWLSAARDEFVEHGHRLSGATIGLVSLCLAIAAWRLDRRKIVRVVATGIFLAVVTQGLLGGARVRLDKQTMAMVHGDFAALVFTLMAILVVITGKGWESRQRLISFKAGQSATKSAQVLLGSLIAQYLMGGFLRHLREQGEFAWAWMVHPWFALVVLFVTACFVVTAFRSESIYIRRCAYALAGLTVAQSLVGLATWYVKYGVPSWGVVAQQDSPPQIVVCSVHTVLGMLTLMASALAVFCCWAVRPMESHRQTTLSVGTHVPGVAT